MEPSHSIDMSLFGMIAIGLFVAFIAAAIARPPLGKNPLHWLCAVGLLVVATLFGVRFMRGYDLMRANEARQAAIERMEEERALLPPHYVATSSDAPSSVAMAEIHGAPATWSETQIRTTKMWGVLFIALLVPFFIFLVSRHLMVASKTNIGNLKPSLLPDFVLWNSEELYRN